MTRPEPRDEPKPETATRPETRAPAAAVALIEDSATQAEPAVGLVRGEACRVERAATAAARPRLIAETKPQAVLLDIELPDMNGLDVLDRLRAERDSPPVVMLTGHSDVATVVDRMRRGAFDFVAKPFNADRLRVSVRNAVERGRMAAMTAGYRDTYENGVHGMIGASPAMAAVYGIIEAAPGRHRTRHHRSRRRRLRRQDRPRRAPVRHRRLHTHRKRRVRRAADRHRMAGSAKQKE